MVFKKDRSASEVFAFVTRLFCGYYVTSNLLSRFITFPELAWPDFVFAFHHYTLLSYII